MRTNIRTKLIGVCLALGIIPTLVVGIVAWNVTQFMVDTMSREYETIAVTIADKIDRNLFERYGDAQAFGLNHIIRDRNHWYQQDGDNPIVQAMNEYVDKYDVYYLTMLVDLEGKLIAANTKDNDGNSIDASSLYDQEYKQASWLHDCKTGRFYESDDANFTGTVVEHLYVDSDVCRVYGDEGLALGFSAPVFDESGQIIAVWKNVAKFSLVEDIFWTTYAELEHRGLGSAELTLLDKDGNIIVDCDPTKNGTEDIARDLNVIGKFNLAKQGVAAAEAAVRGEAGVITTSFHARKKINQVAGFSPLRGALGFPGMDWSVLVRVSQQEAFAAVNGLKTKLLFIAIAVVAVVPIVSLVLSQRITSPIKRALAIFKKMTQGDLTQRFEYAANDEFGELSRGFNALAERLSEMIGTISSDSDLMQESSNKLAQTADRLLEASSTSDAQSTTVAEAAKELSVNMDSMAESSEEMSTSMNTTAVAVEQMQSTIAEIARSAEQSKTVADDATQLADQSNEKIAELGTAADEIGKVIEVIQDIAEQTNLLALNATIEAARAGEAGKGFAVVATEVKELAKQTAAATDDIRGRIEAIQNTTGQAVGAIEAIGKGISDVNEVTRTIAAAVEEQSVTAREISKNVTQAASAAEANAIGVKESANASQEITDNITGLSSTSQQANATAAKTRIGCTELTVVIKRVGRLVRMFNVGEKPAQPEAKVLPQVPQEIRESWERVSSTSFVDTFYDEFMKADPRIAPHFANTDMNSQIRLLKTSLLNVINYPTGDRESQERIMMLAESHSNCGLNVIPELYGFWHESLLKALAQHDPLWNAALAAQWTTHIQPALDAMKARHPQGCKTTSPNYATVAGVDSSEALAT